MDGKSKTKMMIKSKEVERSAPKGQRRIAPEFIPGNIVDVCLINLPKPHLRQPTAQAPMGLLYVAGALERAGHSVCLADMAGRPGFHAPDVPAARVYGITATALDVPAVNAAARALKDDRACHVVVGGPAVYALGSIDFTAVDALSFGDGEDSTLQMMADLNRTGRLKYRYTGDAGELDAAPAPARHLMCSQGGNIFAFNKRYAEGPSAVILSSRGCAFSCAFCAAPKITAGRRMRFRSPSAVAAEIRHCRDVYGVRQFRFSDDMFTATKKRTLALCDAIGPEDVFWRISCRVEMHDDEMLRAMYQAGCRELSFGVESFDDVVLAGLRKRATAAQNAAALEAARKHGFVTRALMMVRTPFQTRQTIVKNKTYLTRLPWDIAACTAFVPLPGCDIWERPEHYGVEILDRDLGNYNFYMYGPEGRREIERVIRIKGRDNEEFHRESEGFRDWLEATEKINRG